MERMQGKTARAAAQSMSRRSFVAGLAGLGALSILGGCSGSESGSAGSSGAASESGGSGAGAPGKVVVGTLATEDLLPLWAAQADGLFDQGGLEVEIVVFQSATELIAGVSSGSVNMAMTDPMVSAGLAASGTDVHLQWVTLGATAAQGRFGIMTGPSSGISSLRDLAGVPIGVGSNTILEYVMDVLMERAGVPADQVMVEELQKLPVRFQAMMSGDVAAAALPGSLLALGEAKGCTTLADDTTGENISQSVMIARVDFLDGAAGAATLPALQAAWDEAVRAINAAPEQYRAVLLQNANLSEDVAETYPISEYPLVQRPTSAMVDPVLAWMDKKGYLAKPLSYNEQTGAFETR